MNKQILLGNLGTDVEMKELDNGTKIATFSLATNEKTKGGEKVTTWHNCLCFNRQAELAADFLTKGSKCLIEGRLQKRSYETKDGEKKWSVETIISSLTFIDPAKNQDKPKNDYESNDDEPF